MARRGQALGGGVPHHRVEVTATARDPVGTVEPSPAATMPRIHPRAGLGTLRQWGSPLQPARYADTGPRCAPTRRHSSARRSHHSADSLDPCAASRSASPERIESSATLQRAVGLDTLVVQRTAVAGRYDVPTLIGTPVRATAVRSCLLPRYRWNLLVRVLVGAAVTARIIDREKIGIPEDGDLLDGLETAVDARRADAVADLRVVTVDEGNVPTATQPADDLLVKRRTHAGILPFYRHLDTEKSQVLGGEFPNI